MANLLDATQLAAAQHVACNQAIAQIQVGLAQREDLALSFSEPSGARVLQELRDTFGPECLPINRTKPMPLGDAVASACAARMLLAASVNAV